MAFIFSNLACFTHTQTVSGRKINMTSSYYTILALLMQLIPAQLQAACDEQAALISELGSKLVAPEAIEPVQYRWTANLGKLAKMKAMDRHLFAIADRFGSAHDLMNSLEQSVEFEYYFQKSNGVKWRGFAMGVVKDDCETTLTYIGAKPYNF